MSYYLNQKGVLFQISRNSEIYVDKSQLISFTNKRIGTKQRYICVTRPRMFGKSMALAMLEAYYSPNSTTQHLFQDLKIASDPDFRTHLGQYDVIKLDMMDFAPGHRIESVSEMLNKLDRSLCYDLTDAYPEIQIGEDTTPEEALCAVFAATGRRFIFLIDEWDCLLYREYPLYRNITDEDVQMYFEYLRNLLNDKPYVGLVYMTGKLPIKRHGEHSVLDMFEEFSIIEPKETIDCFGFTEDEVEKICAGYRMDFSGAKEWYDGYHLVYNAEDGRRECSIYAPIAIVRAMFDYRYDAYWSGTASYESVKTPIERNIAGLKEDVITMLAGDSVPVDIRLYEEDVGSAYSKDGLLTRLTHLGILAYDPDKKTVSIPNKDVAENFKSSVIVSESYKEVARVLQASRKLMDAVWDQDCDAIAAGMDRACQEISILHHDNENALARCIELAFYHVREDYAITREVGVGKGFAAVFCIPHTRYADKFTLVLEMKYDTATDTAIDRIKNKCYPKALASHQENLLLVTITCAKDTKTHSCRIEEWACKNPEAFKKTIEPYKLGWNRG